MTAAACFALIFVDRHLKFAHFFVDTSLCRLAGYSALVHCRLYGSNHSNRFESIFFTFIDRFNRTRAEFPGLKRVDTRDYPPEALREAMLNTIVHRDYSYSGSTFIRIFDDRIEFVTLGGLPKGIAMSDVMMGVSVPRNRRLANIFYCLHLIEAFGTGMLKIKECYAGCPCQPVVETSENVFKITLPNVNYRAETASEESLLSEKERQILKCVSARQSVSRTELETETGLSQSATIRALKRLLELGLI